MQSYKKIALRVFTLLLVFASLVITMTAIAGLSRERGAEPGRDDKAYASPNQPSNTQETEDRTSLRARARKAKARGEKKVTFSAPMIEYPEPVGVDEAVSQTSPVLAQFVDKTSLLLDSHTIGTFYRFKISETLSQETQTGCCSLKDEDFPSASLPPLGENEIYVAGIGGTVMLDEVEVTVKEDFGAFEAGNQYLLFLSLSPSGRYGTIRLGPRGVFRIGPGMTLESFVKQPYKLKGEIENKYGNSLVRLRDGLKDRRGQQ